MLEGKFRSCLCPDEDGKSVCTPCKFIKQYTDKRGWIYFVRSELGENQYKTFYRKPGKKVGIGEHAYRNIPWQDSFDKAQMDLCKLAAKKGWAEVLQ